MENYATLEIVRKLRERRANDPGTNGTPHGLGPVTILLDWAKVTSRDYEKVLRRLCQQTPQLEAICSVCLRPGAFRCRSCGVHYCSEACRDNDWKRHKVVCKLFANWDKSKRPSERHFTALIFPTYREKPELVWCRLVCHASKLEVAHSDFDVLDSLPMRGVTSHVNTSITGRMFLGHGLAMLDVYQLRHLEEEHLANINESIMSLADPGSLTSYAGPHIVFAFKANRKGRPGRGIDVVPADWRHTTDYIILNLMNTFISEPVSESEHFQTGTKLNNIRSRIITKLYNIVKPVETVPAPLTYWPIEGPCVPAVQIGLPWKTRYVQDSEMVSCTFSEEMKYVKKYFLRPESEHHGEHSRWATVSKYRCGSMIVLPLAKHRVVHQHHVLAFNKYLDYSLKRRVVPSKDGFMEYWERYVAIVSHRKSLDDVPNPYHRLPQRYELGIHMGGTDVDYINAIMNLLGHFAERGYVMEVEEKGGVFVPRDVTALFDTKGTFEFTDDERDIPGNPAVERALERMRELMPSSSAEDVTDGSAVEMSPESTDPTASSSTEDIPGGPSAEMSPESKVEPKPSSSSDGVDGLVDDMGRLLD